MSRWVKINIVLFITIVILTLIMRLFTSQQPHLNTQPTPSPQATILPSPSPSPSASVSARLEPEVLGIATDTETNLTSNLSVYESKRLQLMLMVPTEFDIANDRLTLHAAVKTSDQSDAAPYCDFTKITTKLDQENEQILTMYDLPLVSFYTSKRVGGDQAVVNKIYIVKNEENQPKLQVTCSATWESTDAFYTLLRSVRFL